MDPSDKHWCDEGREIAPVVCLRDPQGGHYIILLNGKIGGKETSGTYWRKSAVSP